MTTEAEKTRFIHEAQAAAALNHPNICTIYEIDEADGQQFIAMEFVDGQSLKEKIAAGPLKIDEAINLAIQIAEGLQAAHEKGITHRDIKPANVMITNKGQAKIMDFGLAKLAEQKTRLTKTGMTVGTVAYMSPEQAQGVDADHRADIWSFGVMLYEMITGQLPFHAEYEQAVVYSILNEDAKPISGLRTEVPMELERIVSKAMAKSPDERYQRVDEMLSMLRSLSKKLEAGQPPAAETMQASIAVLPFVDMSPQKDQEYFCDGMAEELINALTKLEGLRVVSRTSAFQFKGKAFDIRKIGEQLNVASVLEGSVRKTGDRLRITAQLINVVDGFHLWSEKYDREMKDVFDIQDEISRAIVDALKIKLVGEAATRLVKRYTENLEAYTLYLKGRYYWNKRTEPGLTKGIEYFEKAITKDPGYALAYAGLADCYNVISHYGAVPPKASVPKAKIAAIKALEIDDALVEAHTSLAFALYNYDFAWLAAEKEFQRAIALNPNYATAHHWYAIYLATRGRLEEAIAEMQRARELDPLSLIINTEVGWMLYFGRHYNQAIEQYQKTLEMDPSFAVAHWGLGLAYQQKAMPQEAIAEFQKAIFCLILWVKFNNLICVYPAGVANGRRPKPIPLFHKRT
jgi:TolB-like protein/Tfp pilus assembly protein PilF